MRRSTPVLTAPEYSVRVVACADEHHGWSTAEPSDSFGLVLPRRGRFRLMSEGVEQAVDVTQGYAQMPGVEQQFAHPSGGDMCTFVSVGARLWREITGDRAVPQVVRVDGVAELAHRLLLRSARGSADPAERLVRTVAAAARTSPSDDAPAAARTPGARAARARLVARARDAVLEDVPQARDLVSLARVLGTSPAHLSRVFQAETGASLTRFRNRVRVSRVLERLEAGDGDLAAIAGDLGFADQAHLTRTVRATTGATPGRLRRSFAPVP
ncbi:helix-turn-helix domain-containing protein [Promicromonospora iranensis]|uniref:AraC-like DNA-binding protein n=1 Tax=Promicromonospora iranensis TaxID=1105144 RepID=A0ABU2CNN3_9MICO|nr:helix-turn-helix domain-containing protein [Promicromonospora iranensis]MDR7382949.1 AraC-like DNA-binding protein [Promicromonospora iranensis]